MQPKNFELTGVFVQDSNAGYTAFFAQLPNIIAEGETVEEAEMNLINTVKIVFEHQKNTEFVQDDVCNNSNVTTKPFNLAFA